MNDEKRLNPAVPDWNRERCPDAIWRSLEAQAKPLARRRRWWMRTRHGAAAVIGFASFLGIAAGTLDGPSPPSSPAPLPEDLLGVVSILHRDELMPETHFLALMSQPRSEAP